MPKTICFISDQDYDFLSNFYEAPFRYLGRTWKTVEHAFQAAKVNFEGPWAKRIATASTAGEAKRLGRKCPLRKDWESVKDDVMREILVAKFLANHDLLIGLVMTDNARIEEDAYWDRYWGTGKTGPGGNGKNKMGTLLMDLRATFRRDMPNLLCE